MADRIILLSSPRSGTNFVLDVLARCRPDSVVLREVFRSGSDSLPLLERLTGMAAPDLVDLAASDPVALWDLASARAGARALAAKIFYHHVAPEAPVWAHLRDTATVVHLVRRNHLAAYLSLHLAKETGVWSVRDRDAPDPGPVRLDPAAAEAFVAQRRRRMARASAAFPRARELAYEDVAASPGACAAALASLGLLSVPPGGVEVAIRRQGGELRDRIANYAEVRHLDADAREPVR